MSTTPPQCHCSATSVLRRVMKEGANHGKYFWTCPAPDSDHAPNSRKLFSFTKFNETLGESIIQKQKSTPRIPEKKSTSTPSSGTVPSSLSLDGPQTKIEVQLCDDRHPEFPNSDQNGLKEWICLSFKDDKLNTKSGLVEPILKEFKIVVKGTSGKAWFIPLKEYDVLVGLVRKDAKLKFSEIPQFVFNILKDNPHREIREPARWANIPKNIRDSLLPFQKEGIYFAIAHDGKILLADDMGLGKTLQTIAISLFYQKEWPLLILCPSALKANWSGELNKWIPSDIKRSISIHEVETGKDDLDGDIDIISYTLASREPMLTKIKNRKYQIIVCDESHYIKEEKSKRAAGLSPILRDAPHCLLLSGTASPSKPIEMFSQLKALNVVKIKKTEFGDRYCQRKDGPYGVDYSGSENLYELNLILSRTVLIRRLKRDVLHDLPKKERKTIYLNLPKTVQAELDQMKRSDSISHLERWKKTGEAKVDEILKYLEDDIKNKVKFLIFAHHISVLDGLEQGLEKLKAKYIRIDGSTPADKRVELANSFRGDSRIHVALLSITVAGTGLSFTPCSRVVFCELQWTPGLLSQSEDRVYRIGQVNDVDIKYLIARDTIDEQIWKNISKKLDVVGQTLDNSKEAWKMGVEDFNPDQATIMSFFKKTGETIEEFDDAKQSRNLIPNLIPLRESDSPPPIITRRKFIPPTIVDDVIDLDEDEPEIVKPTPQIKKSSPYVPLQTVIKRKDPPPLKTGALDQWVTRKK